MKKVALTTVALVSLHATALAQIDVSLTANGNGRAIDYFSNAYAQINLEPDGMYNLSTDAPFGAVDAFPNEGNWTNVGSFTLSGTPTGIGNESFSITGATFDFDPYISGASTFVVGTAYTTSLSGISGTVDLVNGNVDTLTFNSSIAFAFAAAPSNPYDGSLTVTESSFDLSVDDTENLGFSIRFEWDFDGSSSFAVATSAVPEPSTYALIAGSLMLTVAVAYRRRAKK